MCKDDEVQPPTPHPPRPVSLYSIIQYQKIDSCPGTTSLLGQLISRQETDSSAHLDKQSKQRHMSLNWRFDVHAPTGLYRWFWKQPPAICFAYTLFTV